MMNVRTISREIIKPSSPTPPHLNPMKLSSLDQAAPQIYTHIILFYSTTNTNSYDQLPLKLKTSLSQTLTQFYPLAGRIRLSPLNTLHVEHTDDGVEFVESQTEADFSSFLLDPPVDQLDKLLPIKATQFRWVEDPLLAVQLTMFDKGLGFALGISISHMIADGASTALFLNCWADATKGTVSSAPPPRFDSASLFPPQSQLANRPLPEKSPDNNTRREQNVVTKRFVIQSEAVSMLRSWIFSSWCRIRFYSGCDFGWGEAVWVGCGIEDMKDVCILIDSMDGGGGVEVWLWLAREEMERLECDQEFLQFVSSCY